MTTEVSPEGIASESSRNSIDLAVEGLDNGANLAARRKTLNPSAMRELIPIGGLREYWYPAIVEHRVGKRRPTKIKLLGEDVVLYRDKKGGVVACAAVCPHRGGSMGDGHCHYSGTISCPYHGWTFDETGDCVAVLGEGPDSPIPGNEGARLKMYPTTTLKGCVFIWMGQRQPAPLEEDIPPEFFQHNAQVQYSVTNWTCNWRQAIENVSDAHVFYVHRGSLTWLGAPEAQLTRRSGPTRPRPQVINGRTLNFPNNNRAVRGQISGGYARPEGSPYRDAYPGLEGQAWPQHEFVRLRWAKLMTKILPYRSKPHIDPNWRSAEWSGVHLPGTFRSFHQNYAYTRCVVPVTADLSRVFYFNTNYGRSEAERLLNKAWFIFVRKWLKNYNFSGQDQAVMEPQVYNQPEALSATDVFPLALRRLIVERARDVQDTTTAD